MLDGSPTWIVYLHIYIEVEAWPSQPCLVATLAPFSLFRLYRSLRMQI